MRRYFVRLVDGAVKQVENRNDAAEKVERDLAAEWWFDECACHAPNDADPEDHDHDCPEHSCHDECDQAEES